MTRAITAPELALLRSDGQWSEYNLLIDAPDVIYTAVASGGVSSTYTISWSSGSGTLSDCLPDMALLISTSAGIPKALARLRKDPIAGVFFIGADPSIETVAGDILSVLNDFPPFAKHPVGVLMDVDLACGDKFTNFIPVPVIDEGRIAVIDEGETAEFHAPNSWCPDDVIDTYAWTFPGATSYTDEDTDNPTATYETSGRYRWDLTLTTGGKTNVAHGWVYVLGDNLTSDAGFIPDQFEGEQGGGWATKITCLDRPTIRDRARVIIYSKDYYGNELERLGPIAGRENIVMVGWIIGETIVRDPGKNTVEFEIGGPLAVLSRLASLPAGLQNTALPLDKGQAALTAWATMDDLTAFKGLHYLINYRSNLATICDVLIEEWSYPVHKLATEGSNLLSQLDDFAANSAMVVNADRYGTITIERDGSVYPLAFRTAMIDEVITLTDADWKEELAITRKQTSETAMAEAEGVVFNAGSKKVTQVGGRAPGNIPAQYGDTDSITDLCVSTQADVLELAGLMAGSKNGEYLGVTAILAANNRFVDVSPRQFVTVTIDGKTVRCFPQRVVLRTNLDTGFSNTELELLPEGVQWPAMAIDYPGEGQPPVIPPEPPPPPEPPGEPPPPPPGPSDADAVVATGSDDRTTGNLDEASPTWSTEL